MAVAVVLVVILPALLLLQRRVILHWLLLVMVVLVQSMHRQPRLTVETQVSEALLPLVAAVAEVLITLLVQMVGQLVVVQPIVLKLLKV